MRSPQNCASALIPGFLLGNCKTSQTKLEARLSSPVMIHCTNSGQCEREVEVRGEIEVTAQVVIKEFPGI